ncbi:hypothetical protein C8R44DRAFT_752673 [Mycena epipterygia]|nr:hypothetical protein C8R44DRAFT_752673 [Mycena epipterygia]
MPKKDTTDKKKRREERKLKEEQDIRARCEVIPPGRIPTLTLFDVSTIIFEDEDTETEPVYLPARVHAVVTTPRDFSSLQTSLPKKIPVLSPPADIHLLGIDPIQPPLIPILLMPPPLQPFDTTYGPVTSSLALACAREVDYQRSLVRLARVSDHVWGPRLAYNQRHLRDLPPEHLIFLSTLLEIISVEPIFHHFLDPAIMSFVHDWVESQEVYGG